MRQKITNVLNFNQFRGGSLAHSPPGYYLLGSRKSKKYYKCQTDFHGICQILYHNVSNHRFRKAHFSKGEAPFRNLTNDQYQAFSDFSVKEINFL